MDYRLLKILPSGGDPEEELARFIEAGAAAWKGTTDSWVADLRDRSNDE